MQAPNSNTVKAWGWLAQYLFSAGNPSQLYGQNKERGIDITMPRGTTITSLTNGIVLGMGYPNDGGAIGGVVSIKSIVPGPEGKPITAAVYYQHLDVNNPQLQIGSIVHIGDVIGLSGGQTSGGQHPTSPAHSTGAHIEIGINGYTGQPWNALGQNYNPLPWITSLYTGGPGAFDSGVLGTLNATLAAMMNPGTGLQLAAKSGDAQAYKIPQGRGIDNWENILQYMKDIESFPSFHGLSLFDAPLTIANSMLSLTYRTMFILLGIFLFLYGLWKLLEMTPAGPELKAGAEGLEGAGKMSIADQPELAPAMTL